MKLNEEKMDEAQIKVFEVQVLIACALQCVVIESIPFVYGEKSKAKMQTNIKHEMNLMNIELM